MPTKTLDEVKSHNNGKSCWVVIHDKVYDVTAFLEEHPGGEEVLLEVAGTNATEQFEDVGHSSDARELLEQYYVADIHEKDKEKKTETSKPTAAGGTKDTQSGFPTFVLAASLLVLGVAVGYFVYMNRS